MTTTTLTQSHVYVAFWSGEGGAQPLRRPESGELAVWESLDEAERYMEQSRVRLQIVRVRADQVASR